MSALIAASWTQQFVDWHAPPCMHTGAVGFVGGDAWRNTGPPGLMGALVRVTVVVGLAGMHSGARCAAIAARADGHSMPDALPLLQCCIAALLHCCPNSNLWLF